MTTDPIPSVVHNEMTNHSNVNVHVNPDSRAAHMYVDADTFGINVYDSFLSLAFRKGADYTFINIDNVDIARLLAAVAKGVNDRYELTEHLLAKKTAELEA
jgi:hypothetical protein